MDSLVERGGKVLAHEVGADRQLAVTAVHQHRELHAVGAAVVEQGLLAARTVRPVNSTSSTSTTVVPSSGKSMCDECTTGWSPIGRDPTSSR